MARSKNGQAIRESQRTPEKLELLKELLDEAVAQSDLATWRRGRAVLGYIHGKSVAQMTQELDVSLSAVKKWIGWYDVGGIQGLWTRFAPGPAHRLSDERLEHHAPRKVFMVIDNGPCHWLDDAGKKWLAENPDKLELYRLPPYSPEFNPTEGVWKTTRKMTTHNRFFPTVEDRDCALRQTFDEFQRTPELIDHQVARFRDS
jgi:transposase